MTSEIKRVSGDETDRWLGRITRKCTLPILERRQGTEHSFQGSSFVLRHNHVNYIVTAKHVIEKLRNPCILFPTIDRKWQSVSTIDMSRELGLKWIYHPDGLDLAAIPFRILKNFDFIYIDEEMWNIKYSYKIGDHVAHLGYPNGDHANYTDGTQAFFAIAMPGEIINIDESRITTRSDGEGGASGGPLFLSRGESISPVLIGVILEAVLNHSGQYTYKTKSLPIRNVIKIFETKEMINQVKAFENKLKGSKAS